MAVALDPSVQTQSRFSVAELLVSRAIALRHGARGDMRLICQVNPHLPLALRPTSRGKGSADSGR